MYEKVSFRIKIDYLEEKILFTNLNKAIMILGKVKS